MKITHLLTKTIQQNNKDRESTRGMEGKCIFKATLVICHLYLSVCYRIIADIMPELNRYYLVFFGVKKIPKPLRELFCRKAIHF